VLAAGVVDEHVDAAVASERRVDERLYLVLLAHIAGLGPGSGLPATARRSRAAARHGLRK